jgi:uncharacterized phage protein (TIGR01671 family)
MLYDNEIAFVPPIVSNVTQTLRDGLQLLQKKYVVMQFTGLHDKNGKEIYEGDIVRFPICPVHGQGTDASRCITWDDYKYTLTRVANGKDQTDYWLGYLDHEIEPEELEIVGNIYQNPELMEAGGLPPDSTNAMIGTY